MLLLKSAYGAICSSLMDLHKLSGLDTPDAFIHQLSQLHQGFKRIIAEERFQSGLSLKEGKKANVVCRVQIDVSETTGERRR